MLLINTRTEFINAKATKILLRFNLIVSSWGIVNVELMQPFFQWRVIKGELY